jgi:hypothetical protein
MQILYQEMPYKRCTYRQHKQRSFTDCMESNQNGAQKECLLLRHNGRIPSKELTWHLLNVHTVEEISDIRSHVFGYLQSHGIEAVAAIELTRDAKGFPNNTVHFHLITDSERSEEEIAELMIKACRQKGLRKQDIRVDRRQLWDGYKYFNYFTKYGYENKVILFQKGLYVQKFYQIGKWYRTTKKELWAEIIEETKQRAKQRERRAKINQYLGNPEEYNRDLFKKRDEYTALTRRKHPCDEYRRRQLREDIRFLESIPYNLFRQKE